MRILEHFSIKNTVDIGLLMGFGMQYLKRSKRKIIRAEVCLVHSKPVHAKLVCTFSVNC